MSSCEVTSLCGLDYVVLDSVVVLLFRKINKATTLKTLVATFLNHLICFMYLKYELYASSATL